MFFKIVNTKMARKILITGSKGQIGSVLLGGLRNYILVEADLPETDVRDYATLLKKCKGIDAIIHLAWDTNENHRSKTYNPDNSLMFLNVYKASLELGIKRVIMASSVHADEYVANSTARLYVNQNPKPNSPYGAHKIFMEKMGYWYSQQGLEIICIRFGGVCGLNRKPWNSLKIEGLAHADCLDLIEKCLSIKTVPQNYMVLYGVSNNKLGVHDFSNPLGWKPILDAAEFYNWG